MEHPTATGRRAGFTLVELLLTVVLLFLLIGAMVFNFNQLQIGASLDEGALRIQTMLRLAEAEAARSGRRVQLQFVPDNDLESLSPLYSFELVWEPDPLQKPGTFEKLNRDSWNLKGVNDIVGVAQVLTKDSAATPAPGRSTSNSSLLADPADSPATSYPPLTFYPDGTSDSIRLILASRTEDDDRQLQLTWLGLSGTVSVEPLHRPSSLEQISEEESGLDTPSWRDPTGRETQSTLENVY